MRKVNFYCLVFDFNCSGKNLKEKEIKRQTLSHLVEFVGSAMSNSLRI